MAYSRLPTISGFTLRFFRWIVRGYFRRHFHGVRVSGAERLSYQGRPLIIYANHGSWWDPMISVLLAQKFLPEREHFAPMDADALDRYAILKRIGIFPVEMKTARGAVQFLRTGEALLRNGGVVWVTPQGQFVDARERPLVFKPGLAALARRAATQSEGCTVLPMAIEYPFWDERLPEALVHVGEAIQVSSGIDETVLQQRLLGALETVMDELKSMSMQRDARRFHTVLGGRAGAGGFYALGQRIKAFAQRRPYRPEHTLPLPGDVVREHAK